MSDSIWLDGMFVDVRRLIAERDRLREALERIAGGPCYRTRDGHYLCAGIARAALGMNAETNFCLPALAGHEGA